MKPFIALALAALVLAGCSTVNVRVCLPDAVDCSAVKLRGKSTLEEPVIIYERELEDGTVIRFRFQATKTEREGNTIDKAIADAVVEKLLNQ